MSSSSIRESWCRLRAELDRASDYTKQPQELLEHLLCAYDALAPHEQPEVHEVLAEWLASDNIGWRSDAAFLASSRSIIQLKPPLQAVIQAVAHKGGPNAIVEMLFLQRLFDTLGSAGST